MSLPSKASVSLTCMGTSLNIICMSESECLGIDVTESVSDDDDGGHCKKVVITS